MQRAARFLLCAMSLAACLGLYAAAPVAMQGAPFAKGKFANDEELWDPKYGKLIKALMEGENIAPRPAQPIPLRPIPASELGESASPALYRLGHSTILIRLDGRYLLTDPMFSKRASPLQWVGPKRFHPSPIAAEDLPALAAVIISHDHYDHLDRRSIQALDGKTEKFFVPLRVGKHLRDWGVAADKIVELDWWQGASVGSLQVTATPAQHFSGRGLFDRDETLWASWVIEGEQGKLFFSGDTGYFNGLKDIGERFGPFDVTMLEAGAYNPAWATIHMMPADTIQAHIDLGGKALLPIHNSTFDLSNHPWYDPLETVSALAATADIQVLTPMFGESVSITAPDQYLAWWRDAMPAPATVAATD